MLKIGDVFIHDRKKYVVVDISQYTTNTEMFSMHYETIYTFHCRRIFKNGRLGKMDEQISSYNHYNLKAIDNVKVNVEYSISEAE